MRQKYNVELEFLFLKLNQKYRNRIEHIGGSSDSKAGWMLVHVLRTEKLGLARENATALFPL